MIEKKEIASYKDYGRVVCITNGIIEVYVTVDLGPRIIRFGFVGGQNIVHSTRSDFEYKTDRTFEEYFGKGKGWENYGGHRIWLSPESYPETYYPDNDPVRFEPTEAGGIFTPAPETENGVAKQLEIKMDPDDSNLQVIMRAKNIGNIPKDFAIWGLTVSEKTGTVIIPMNTNDTGLLSNRIISVWPYTDMGDHRIRWGDKYVTVTQDPTEKRALKIGFDLDGGNVYYVLNDDVFCKHFATNHPNGNYPDNGCSFETYTNNCIIEIESLGELKTVSPGEVSVHTESWSLHKKSEAVDFGSDASIDKLLKSL